MLERPKQIQLIRRAESYLTRVFGTATHIHPMPVSRGLPFLITDQYGFFEGGLAGQPCIFLVPLDGLAPPQALQKQLRSIRTQYPHRPVLLVMDQIDSRSRARLIANHISFVVPELQLYAPVLATDLRERGLRLDAPLEHLSPSAQLLVIAHLLRKDIEHDLAARLAERLGVAAMSMSRAFAELEALELASVTRQGKERRLTFRYEGRRLWENVLSRLRSPVRKYRGIPSLPARFPALMAGETALSHYTNLMTPRIESYAIEARQWAELSAQFKLHASDTVMEEDHILETWSYDPATLSVNRYVDPLSLYLSVRNNSDERVAKAADELLNEAFS